MRGWTVVEGVRGLLAAGLTVAALLALPSAGPLITLPAALAAGTALLTRPPHLATPAVAAVSLAATAAYRGPAGNEVGPWWLLETAALLALTVPAARRALRHAVLPVLALTALPLRVGLHLDPPSPADELTVICLLAAAASGAAVAAGRHLRAQDARRAHAVREARRAQRIALARDLHDFVAHEVSGMLVQAQAGQLVAAGDPDAAMAVLRRIEAAGLRAMDTLEETVRMLDADDGEDSGPTAPGAVLAELTAAVQRYGSATLDLDPAVRDVPPSAHRLVTEALTNVRRHAPGCGDVRVTVARGGEGLTVRVLNTAPPAATARPAAGAGTGLAALRRRLATEDATLTAGPTPSGGWHTTAVWGGA
ncbi:sensor histidine kinase [Streptomyces xiamenensis]|uniref:sensor histidine kinase n=1 Tax=Streptomyces xiamenensis TaxID=408015 RepID=UPI0035E203CC